MHRGLVPQSCSHVAWGNTFSNQTHDNSTSSKDRAMCTGRIRPACWISPVIALGIQLQDDHFFTICIDKAVVDYGLALRDPSSLLVAGTCILCTIGTCARWPLRQAQLVETMLVEIWARVHLFHNLKGLMISYQAQNLVGVCTITTH